jgi:hypothetical protein
VRVFLDGNNITNRSGVSANGFSYKPPAPLTTGSHHVRVTGAGTGGMTFDRAWNFTVAQAPPPPATMHLRVNSPAAGSSVSNNFTVSGNTVANGRIRVTAGATPSTTGQFTGTATAGPMGNFNVAVKLKRLLGQQTVSVRIVATDPATSQTRETTLQLQLTR